MNVGLLEFLEYRTNLATKICKNEDMNIEVITGDFFTNKDLFNYDLLFCNNIAAPVVNYKIDEQVDIYTKFLESDKKKDIIMNAERYGEDENKNTNIFFYKILDILQSKKFTINQIIVSRSCNFYRISNYNYDVKTFSEQFTSYNLINNNNIKDGLVPDSKNNILKDYYSINISTDNKEKHKSFGLFFLMNGPIMNKFMNKKTLTLSFYARSETVCNLKIYTGSKWINIDKSLTNDYELFEIEAEFDFKSRSTYRIGLQNINEINNNKIYILNPLFSSQ